MDAEASVPDRIRAFLADPQPAVIAGVRPDGQPVSVATWYLLDGDDVLVNMDAGRRRLAYLRADPRVSLTVLDGVGWYSHVSLQGRIVCVDLDKYRQGCRYLPYRVGCGVAKALIRQRAQSLPYAEIGPGTADQSSQSRTLEVRLAG